MFTFRQEGFDVSIEMLTNKQRSLFKDIVKRKYNIDVKQEQIVSLIPSKFECQTIFYKDAEKILINGKVTQLTRFPLKLSFFAPLKTKERMYFEERLKQEQDYLNLDITCEINSEGKAYRQNTLVITGQQMNQLGLVEDIFGKGSEVYVTRNQVSSVSSELYQRLNVIEEYQMPETQFKENFLNDFIMQTASEVNKYVSIDKALSQLSKYDFQQDIQPNVIKSEFSKLLTIKKFGSKELLQINTTQYEKLKTNSDKDISNSGSISFSGINFGSSVDYTSSRSSEWEKQSTFFQNQLNELNTYDKNEIEWARSGNIVIPKSIKVSKLGKSFFSKNLVFSRVKREFYDAPYKRIFKLDTLSSIYAPDILADSFERIRKLEEKDKVLENNLGNLQQDTELKAQNLTNFLDEKISFNSISIGDIKYSTMQNDFNGWLYCDGRLLSRKDYSDLFSVIGTTYGSSNADYFRIPDLRGRSIVSAGQGNALTMRYVGQIGGEEMHVLTVNEMPSHDHAIYGQDNIAYPTGSVSNEVANIENKWSSSAFFSRSTGQNGGNQAHNNMHPFIVLNSFIFSGKIL